MKRMVPGLLAAVLAAVPAGTARADLQPVVPIELRGQIDAERSGTHDANRLRTVFWNYGMVGDYPPDPGNVDLSVFHSCEAPKGSGMNYSDGITPFVMARIVQASGDTSVIMETGFRERQGISPRYNRIMRFEPRPRYFQADPRINVGRSPAISSDPRTWPGHVAEPRRRPRRPGLAGELERLLRQGAGRRPGVVHGDGRRLLRRLGLRARHARLVAASASACASRCAASSGANPQAGNVIFWHYDITNESTTDYLDDIIFGLYMDSGVGGSALSCDGYYESDDDNAFFDRSSGLNLVYTWDMYGHGVDLSGNCGRTGYLGYAYMETPGNPYDGLDNDGDGITDEPATAVRGRASTARRPSRRT